MIVIVEGCDLAGKTYAIERIGKYFNSGFILKNTYKPKTCIDSDRLIAHYWEIVTIIMSYNQRNSEDLIILDRLYPSQAVYSILRGVDELDNREIKVLDKFFAESLNAKMIYLDTPIELLQTRFQERGDEHIKMEQLSLLKQRYETFLGQTRLPVLKLDTTKENWLKEVEVFIK